MCRQFKITTSKKLKLCFGLIKNSFLIVLLNTTEMTDLKTVHESTKREGDNLSR